jgi:hypothetical protein
MGLSELAQDRVQSKALENMVLKYQAPKMTGNFLTTLATTSFSKIFSY